MNLRNTFNLGVKELRGLWRDPVMLVLIVYSFSLSIWTSANVSPEALTNAAISIVDEDQSHLSARITSAFYPPYFVEPQMTTTAEMDRRMDQGLDTFALNIPPDFARDVLAGKNPAIQLNIDATRMSQAFTGGGYIQQIALAEVREFTQRYRAATALPVALELRARFNPGLNKIWFGALMQIINNVTMLSIILTGAALIREREHGTIEHLLVMPVTPTQIMLAKVWSMGAVVLLAAGISLHLVVRGLLQVPVEGSIPLFMAGAALCLFATTAMGIFLATIARSMPQFGLLMVLILLPLQLLSGSMTPRESMPELVQSVMLLAPTTHFVELGQAILYRGAGLDVVWQPFLALAAIGSALFALSLARFRKTISQMA